MFENIIATIQKRTRAEWHAYAKEQITDLRIWIQEHGERAALIALCAGIIVVLAFKLVIGLLALTVIAAFVMWQIAPERHPVDGGPGTTPGSTTPGGSSSTSTTEIPDPLDPKI